MNLLSQYHINQHFQNGLKLSVLMEEISESGCVVNCTGVLINGEYVCIYGDSANESLLNQIAGMHTGDSYSDRNNRRKTKLERATKRTIMYFVNSGDSLEDAQDKVRQMSDITAPYLYAYILGNKSLLLGAIDDLSIPFITTEDKEEIKSYL